MARLQLTVLIICSALGPGLVTAEPPDGGATRVFQRGSVRIESPWTDYRIGAGGSTRLYFVLRHTGSQPDRLLSARSTVAGSVSLRLATLENGQRRELALETIPVPAESGRLEFSALGYFVELNDLDVPLSMGARFLVTLEFERAGTLEITVENRFHPPDLGERIIEAVQGGDPDALRQLRDEAR